MERGGSSHVVICDLMRRYGCRTLSSSGREKAVDDRQIDRTRRGRQRQEKILFLSGRRR